MAKKKNAFKRTEFIAYSKNVDILKMANKLLKSVPLIINFEDYGKIESNQVITFLSGVIYALDGEIEQIQEEIFLFATKDDYKDGSLRKFIREHKE